jgi:hypothetical protein
MVTLLHPISFQNIDGQRNVTVAQEVSSQIAFGFCEALWPRSTLDKLISAGVRCPDRRRCSAARRVSDVKERALAEGKVCQPCRAQQDGSLQLSQEK